jgi:hypothetical protein
MRTVTLYRLSGLAVMIGMTIDGFASFLYSRAGGVALYLDPLVPINDLAKPFGSLIFLIGLPGLYAFQAPRAGRLGLAGFVLSFFGLAILEVSTEAIVAFVGPLLAAHDETRFLLQRGLEQNLGGGFLAWPRWRPCPQDPSALTESECWLPRSRLCGVGGICCATQPSQAQTGQ